jgi:N-acetylmuramoyl-L-alanine amidase
MKIKEDNRLYHEDDTPFPFVPSPNFDLRVQPLYLIIHYTAGETSEGAIAWLTNPQPANPDGRVSVHLVISRTGEITQLVSFDRIAWHAGFSYWEGRRSMNSFSIGIELDNDGNLNRKDGGWISAAGAVYRDDQVLVTTHWKHFREFGWLKYPDAQIHATLEVAQLLKQQYNLIDVLGHEDVQQDKVDPGPAFPMAWFRQQVFGRPEPLSEKFSTNRATKVYENVDGQAPHLPPRLAVSPIPSGTPVKVLKEITAVKTHKVVKPAKKAKKGEGKKKPEKKVLKQKDTWELVRILHPVNGLNNIQGWVKKDDIQDHTTVGQVIIYKDLGANPDPEPPVHPVNFLPPGTIVRKLETQPPWVLVWLGEPLPRFKFLMGWIYLDDLANA